MKQRKNRYFLLIFCLILLLLAACNRKSAKNYSNSNNKLSQILNVKNLQIKSDGGYGSLRIINPVVENKNYVFYIEDGKRVIKVNKHNKEKTAIIVFKNLDKGGLSLEGNYLYYIYNQEVYRSDFKGKHVKILSKENLKKSGINAKVVSVKMYHNKLYLIMEDDIFEYIIQYNEKIKKYKTLIKKDGMTQICFLGEYLYYIDRCGAGMYEMNLNTTKQRRIRGVKWYRDFSMDHPIYTEMTVYNGKLYYTRWEEDDDTGRQVMYEYHNDKEDKKLFEFQGGGGDAIADSTKVIVYGTVMYDSDHEVMQVYDLKNKKSYFIKKPYENVGSIDFLFDDIIIYTDNNTSGKVYVLKSVKKKNK